jgi:hypothetical protein
MPDYVTVFGAEDWARAEPDYESWARKLGPEALPALQEVIADQSAPLLAVRRAVVLAGIIGSQAGEHSSANEAAREAIGKAVGHMHYTVRLACAGASIRIGADFAQELLSHLSEDPHPSVQGFAKRSLVPSD